MNKRLKRFHVMMLLLLPACLSGQEICDNGLDDDHDQLIDLNDPDCICTGPDSVVYSLLKNPSFEESDCCPSEVSQFECLAAWDWGDLSTTDYFHVCGFMGHENIPSPPMPLPDGNGFIGFHFGGQYASDYKEYATTCLNKPLRKGQSYQLDFQLGFGTPGVLATSASPMEIALFGATDCSEYPFEFLSSDLYNCPTDHDPAWIELGSVSISGRNEWVEASITFVVPDTIKTLIIGPPCPNPPSGEVYYYFLDQLNLNETVSFDLGEIKMASGMPCTGNALLQIPPDEYLNLRYQWYADGIAIPGATGLSYQTVDAKQETAFQVRAMTGNACRVSSVFRLQEVSVSLSSASWENATCLGVNDASILVDETDVAKGIPPFVYSLNEEQEVPLGRPITGLPGNQNYQIVIRDGTSCRDSLSVFVDWVHKLKVDLGRDREIHLGEAINIHSVHNAVSPVHFEWTLSNGTSPRACINCPNYTFIPNQNTRIAVSIRDANACTANDSLFLKIIENRKVFIPSAFTPNGDGINDSFQLFLGKSATNIKRLKIYTRQGTLVYDSGLSPKDVEPIWNGTFKEAPLPNGVYTYLADIEFLDGIQKQFAGDVTLVK